MGKILSFYDTFLIKKVWHCPKHDQLWLERYQFLNYDRICLHRFEKNDSEEFLESPCCKDIRYIGRFHD